MKYRLPPSEGAALISGIVHGQHARGAWHRARGGNLFDGSAPFYASYACADGRYVGVGAVEPRFHAQLLTGLVLAESIDPALQFDRDTWPETKRRIAEVFVTRPRDAWAAVRRDRRLREGLTPVLSPREAAGYPRNAARGTFTQVAGHLQPSPAPRLPHTPADPVPLPPELVHGLHELSPGWRADG